MTQMSRSAPKHCDCHRQLPKPAVFRSRLEGYGAAIHWITEPFNQCWQTKCDCGAIYVWSFPNVWIKRHTLPLFDEKKTLPQLFNFYGEANQ